MASTTTTGPGRSEYRRTTLKKESSSISSIVRDAKGLSLDLKSMLKRKHPSDREVEFQLEALRKAYLQIIFAPNPFSSTATTSSAAGLAQPPAATNASSASAHASRALDALTLLWLETTHAVIHLYRAKLAEMDKEIAEAPQAHRKNRRDGTGMGPGGGGAMVIPPPVGPYARRKLIHSFRQFLGQEQDRFRILLGRLAADLSPSDLDRLRPLGIDVDLDDAELQAKADRSEEEMKRDRARAIPLAHKALICYGDLARYRELYNESGSSKRDVAGDAGASQRGGKRGKVDAALDKKSRNWSKAAECYHQARVLIPDNGNPSNQLAVLAQYQLDTLSSTYHYYRALCVRQPFSTARMNLDITYTKAVKRWFASDGGDHSHGADTGSQFRIAFVALQGLYFTQTRLSDITPLSQHTQTLFQEAVENRLLTSDVIVKVVVTSICALWQARAFRSSQRTHRDKNPSTTAAPVNLEPHILVHVLSLYRILLTIGSIETNELVSVNLSNSRAQEDVPLAQFISAVLRRALPALRILSKWIMGQLEYISRVEARVQAKEQRRASHRATQDAQDPVPAAASASTASPNADYDVSSHELGLALEAFWHAFADFNNSIKLAFPLDGLPSAREGGVWLEEDVDLLGFAPLRRGLKEGVAAADGMPAEVARVGQDVHPNDEQLMRIAELQADALLIADTETALIKLEQGAFVFVSREEGDGGSEVSPEALEAQEVAIATQRLAVAFGINHEPIPAANGTGPLHRVDEIPTRGRDGGESYDVGGQGERDGGDEEVEQEATDDDPVDLAMRVGEVDHMDMSSEYDYEDDDEDEEEQIVYAGVTSSPASLAYDTKDGGPGPAIDGKAGTIGHGPVGVASGGGISRGGGVALPHQGTPTNRAIWGVSDNQLQRPSAAARGSFEALPNLNAPARSSFQPSVGGIGASIWAANATNAGSGAGGGNFGAPGSGPASQFGQTNSAAPALFGSFSPFASTSPSRTGQQQQQQQQLFNSSKASDLSASAAAFVSRSPQRPGAMLGGPSNTRPG